MIRFGFGAVCTALSLSLITLYYYLSLFLRVLVSLFLIDAESILLIEDDAEGVVATCGCLAASCTLVALLLSSSSS